ncbi:MAG: 4Fe-4S binding protein [bacterium]
MNPDMAGNMAGIPDWLYYSSIVIVMLVSVLILEISKRKPERAESSTFELTKFKAVERFFKSRTTQVLSQLFVVFLFLVILFAGFYGNQHPGRNIAPTLTWNIWWIGLIFLILFFGKMWCYACPWEALTSWLTRLSLFKFKKDSINLGWKWPRWLKNIYLAAILFVFLTWLELGYHITLSPEATATLGLIMFGLVFIPGMLFEKKSFCRYGCLIGRVSGLYAMFAPVEIRARSLEVCSSCKTADCLTGNGNSYPCPTGQYLKTMRSNTYCIMCAECFRSCPHDNVAFNIRPFAADLADVPKPRKDEAYLALIMFALTAFHGLTMTPNWKSLVRTIQVNLSVNEIAAFTFGMMICLALPVLVYGLFVTLSGLFSGDRLKSPAGLFATYAYGLIPIALFYHIAHNVEHFFMESQKLAALISDPFGFGWDLFGTAYWRPEALLSLETIWYVQVGLVIIGHVFGIVTSHKQAYLIFEKRATAIRSQIPMIGLMILFSVLSLWLIAQPMEMRTGM